MNGKSLETIVSMTVLYRWKYIILMGRNLCKKIIENYFEVGRGF